MGGRTKIDWCDSTINPVIGCSRGCGYCYARKLNARWKWVEDFGKPQFFPAALEQPYKWKGPRIIFVCSLGELFDPLVPTAWTHRVFAMMGDNPRHRFLILTKMPSNAKFWIKDLPIGSMMGESIVKYNHDDKSARTTFRLNAWPIGGCDHFISFEPLLGPAAEAIDDGTRWIIIGAQTNPNKQPEKEWVDEILDVADEWGIPVLMKHNLEWPAGERRFEFPAELEKIRSNG